MAEDGAASPEHLGEVAQAELASEPPEHQGGDDAGRTPGPIQCDAGAPVELPAAESIAGPATALRRPFRPLADPPRGQFIQHLLLDQARTSGTPAAGHRWRKC